MTPEEGDESSSPSDRAVSSGEMAEGSLAKWEAAPFLEKVTGVAPSIIYVFNQQTQSSEYSNRSLGESLGYEPTEIQEMGAEFMPRLCHPDDLPRMGAYFEAMQAMDDGEVSEFVYRMRHRDGGWSWLVSHDTVFDRDDDQTVIRHLGVATDITAQKEAEASLQRANDQLSALNTELAELTYAATHDLRAPITNIAGLVGLLEEVIPADDEAEELIGMIKRSCRQATDRIAAVVRVTQARIADLQDEPAAWPIAPLLDDAIETLHPRYGEVGGELTTDLAVSEVVATELALRSIFENLLGNAVKYASPERPLRIKVRSERADGATIVSVADNGRGIDLERDGDRLFGLFQRGVGHDVPGSGIGLYLVRQMMERLGGSVTVGRSADGGTEFSLRFRDPLGGPSH